MDRGGVAAMELVARELKALGLYVARSLSFEGVEYEPLVHPLTSDDIAIWEPVGRRLPADPRQSGRGAEGDRSQRRRWQAEEHDGGFGGSFRLRGG